MASKELFLLILAGLIPNLVTSTPSHFILSRTQQSNFTVSGPHCYTCDAVLYPSECKHITLCDTAVLSYLKGNQELENSMFRYKVTTCYPRFQFCFTERYNDSTDTEVYRLGCRPVKECNFINAPETCQSCCNTSHCNNLLCDALATNHILCYNCEELKYANSCDIIVPCEQHSEKCFIEKVVTDTYKIRYNSGCLRNNVCDGIAKHWGVEKRSKHYQQVGNKRSYALANICAQCCEGEKCNGIDCVIE